MQVSAITIPGFCCSCLKILLFIVLIKRLLGVRKLLLNLQCSCKFRTSYSLFFILVPWWNDSVLILQWWPASDSRRKRSCPYGGCRNIEKCWSESRTHAVWLPSSLQNRWQLSRKGVPMNWFQAVWCFGVLDPGLKIIMPWTDWIFGYPSIFYYSGYSFGYPFLVIVASIFSH